MRAWFRKHEIALTLLLALAVMALIFCFSAQDGEESGRTSGFLTALALRLFVPDYASLTAPERTALYERVSLIVRKSAHFGEFALLGFSLALHFLARARREGCARPALWAALTGILYAGTDELHQIYVAGRGPSLRDVGIDALGVLFGLTLVFAYQKMRRKRLFE